VLSILFLLLLNRFDKRITGFAEEKFQRDGIEVCTGFRVVKVADDLITMKSKTAGEALVPYGMAVWSAGIGTRPVIMDFMHQIGQVVARHVKPTLPSCPFKFYLQIR
jgi:NADH:ubiquinone reductase (non-electrogenic)